METVKITVAERKESGKGPARRLRKAGSLPAVVYGRGMETVPVAMSTVALRTAFSGGSVILELEGDVAGLPRYAVIKQLQVHPVRHAWVHVDLEAVDLSEEMETTLPVTLLGLPRGVVEGGVLDDHHHEVTVRSLPEQLPGAIELDVSGLQVGDSVHVSDLTAPEGVTIVDDPGTVLASVLAPTLEPVEEVEEEVTEVPEAGEEAPAAEE